MYAGKIVEYGTSYEVFFDPKHPYTWALLSSIPDIDSKENLKYSDLGNNPTITDIAYSEQHKGKILLMINSRRIAVPAVYH